jgi:hypothetical protein
VPLPAEDTPAPTAAPELPICNGHNGLPERDCRPSGAHTSKVFCAVGGRMQPCGQPGRP